MLGGTLLISGFATASSQNYKAIAEFKLPGAAAQGIAVDAGGRRLFVAVDGGIAVLNADTGISLGMIPLAGAEDVLLVPGRADGTPVAATRGFATGDGKIISFSTPDLKGADAATLPTAGASSLCYDPEADLIVAVSAGGSLASLDARSGKLLGSAKVPTGAGQIACGTLNHVYVADTAANMVHVLNHATGKNEGDLPMTRGHQPSGLALDVKGRRLFVACQDGTIEIIDTDSGFTFIQLQGGKGPAKETFAWTPQGKGQWKAADFVAYEDGTLTGIRMNAYIRYVLGGEYKLSPGLRSIAYDSKTHHLFLPSIHHGAPVIVVAGY